MKMPHSAKPGLRSQRRAVERLIMGANKKAIKEAATNILREQEEKRKKGLAEKVLAAGRHEKQDPKSKAVRTGPRAEYSASTAPVENTDPIDGEETAGTRSAFAVE